MPVTRQTRCWPSSEATAHPSLPTEVESSLAPCFLLSPEKPLYPQGVRRIRKAAELPTAAQLLGFAGGPFCGDSPAPNTHAPSLATNGPTRRFFCLAGSLLAAPGNRPQIAAQRPGRVNRVDRRDTLDIVTFGTVQLNEPPSVAAAHHSGNADFP